MNIAKARPALQTIWLALLLSLIFVLFIQIPVYADMASPNETEITNVYAWRNVLETNDLLFVAIYSVNYTAIPDLDISEAFLFRLMSDNLSTDYAATLAYPYQNSGYGKGVVSFYFAAADAPAWSGQYAVVIQGKDSAFDDPPVYVYQIPQSAYSSLTDSTGIQLDIYDTIIDICELLEENWGTDYDLTESTGTDMVLTLQGEAYFLVAVPGLNMMSPALFYYQYEDPQYDERDWATNESDEWEARHTSDDIGTGIQSFADIFQTDFMVIAALPVVIVCICLIVAGAASGNMLSGLMNSCLVLTVSAWEGFFPAITLMILAFAALIFVGWHLLFKPGG